MKSEPMNILITNDDGIHSDGLRELVRRFGRDHRVWVAAPDTQRSAASHSVTYFRHDLFAEEIPFAHAQHAWAISGTPADCVFAALCGLMDVKPDLVISGINDGWNVSEDCIYSGTVGAASEGTILGIPSAAVSVASSHPSAEMLEAASAVCAELIPLFLQDEKCMDYVLNINVPALPLEKIRGIRPARFDGRRRYGRQLDLIPEENGKLRLHCPLIDVPSDQSEIHEDGDLTLVKNGYVTLSPITLDWIRSDRLTETERMAEECTLFDVHE